MEEKLQPQLRFPRFEEDWESDKFNKYVKLSQGLQIPISERLINYIENSYFYITNEFLRKNSTKKYYILNPSKSVICFNEDILMTRTGNTGKVITGVNGVFHNNFFKIAYNATINKNFLFYYLTHPKTQHIILTRAGTSTIPDLNHSDFYAMYFTHPNLPEQQKIADYLSTIDTKINLLGEKKTELSRYKKAIMQKLFSREVRFKDENGKDFSDWEEKRLGGIADRINTKNKKNNQNILTISGKKGLINQFDYYKNQYAAKDVTNYLLIKKNDFAYNKSYSKGYPFGAIKRLNNYQEGVLSTLYICFRFKEAYNNSYFEHFFESGSFNNNLYKICVEGARNHGLLNVSINEFFNERLFAPSLIEQQKIANFLSAIDEGINKVEEQEKQMQAFKKAMLQQMFV